jgi:uncharacterized protein (TIGR03083 family)
MTMTRADITEGYGREVAEFETLLRSLDDAQWATPTRCAGWRVADVAAHVTGALAIIVAGRVDEFADPDHVGRHVADRAGKTRDEVVDEFSKASDMARQLLAALDDEAWASPLPGGIAPTLGQGVETLWYDTYVHAEDIRSALGRGSGRGAGLQVSVMHLADLLTDRGWGPATLELDGLDAVPVSGGGQRVTGDPLAFVLAATGRGAPGAVGLDETVNVYR